MDDREPKKVQKACRKQYPDLVVRRMDVGDYIHGNVCIERKTALDFASSIRDGRLYSQVLAMRQFANPLIIMEGSYEDVRTNRYQDVSINEFIGAMADCCMLYKVPVLHCENNSQFARYADSLFRKADGETPEQKFTRVNKWKGNQELSCLLGIYGLGEKRARAILKQFDFRGLCEASVDDLMSVKGIGNKYAKAIKEVFK
jgi:ERCC4-type nuclease